jgi:hypothetical protein
MPRIRNSAYPGVAVFLVLFATVLCPSSIQAQTPPRVKVSIVANQQEMGTQPMTVFAGQAVTVSIKASVAGTVVSPRWQGSWTAVSDYPATVQSAKVIPVDIYQQKQDTVKFYWIDQGPKQVTVVFYLKNACIEGPANCVGQGSVTAYFNVVGPTNVKVAPVTSGTFITDTGAKLNVTGKVTCYDGGTKVGLADGETSAGIVFKATATMPSGSSGTFAWVQLINIDNYQYSGFNGKTAEERYDGLDLNRKQKTETYVYGYGDWVDDSPGMPLGAGNGFTQVTRQMTATMYLMWLGDSAKDTIPVPIGAITWWTGWTVTFNPKSTDPTCKWTISGGYVKPYRFVLDSAHYPIWTHPSQIPTAQ